MCTDTLYTNIFRFSIFNKLFLLIDLQKVTLLVCLLLLLITVVVPAPHSDVPKEELCIGHEDGEPFENPNNCTTFILCKSEFPLVLPCAADKVFVLELRSCVLGNVETCEPFSK